MGRVTTATSPAPSAGDHFLTLLPGLALAAGIAVVSVIASRLVHGLSALLVAIVLGALVGNLTSIGGDKTGPLWPGLTVASRRVLRLGVVLLGLQLALGDVISLGWPALLGVIAVVAAGMGVTLLVGRLLGVESRLSLLVAAGFSICGAAAVAGVDGVLRKREAKDTATALALVVLFGTAMIAVMPWLTHLLGLDVRTAAVWTGASVHEVAQVVAAASGIGPDAVGIAVVVKLTRVLLLAPVLMVVAWRERRDATDAAQGKRPPLVPLFVAGFIAMVLVRTTGVLPASVISFASVVQTFLLATAMAALGIGVHRSALKAAGARAVVLATIATLAVLAVGGATAAVSHWTAG